MLLLLDVNVCVCVAQTWKQFTPLGSVKIIETRIDRVEGRKVYVTATLTDGEDGTLHADASALFLVVNLQQIRDQIHKGNNRPSS
jgi:predicted thioesterase